MEKVLTFKWTVSRGRDTYGYNICSLYVDGHKVSSCNGGGYDMQGTALGDWIAGAFSDELLKLNIPMSNRNGQEITEYYGLSFHDPDYDPGKRIIDDETIEEREKEGKSLGLERYQSFYEASSKVPTERHIVPLIDGACGFSSVERIVNALGYKLKYITDSRNTSTYLLTDA